MESYYFSSNFLLIITNETNYLVNQITTNIEKVNQSYGPASPHQAFWLFILRPFFDFAKNHGLSLAWVGLIGYILVSFFIHLFIYTKFGYKDIKSLYMNNKFYFIFDIFIIVLVTVFAIYDQLVLIPKFSKI